ncbi:hypothetical protein S7711_11020, partial [Stachybotrys chartarum IBT 7711]
TL